MNLLSKFTILVYLLSTISYLLFGSTTSNTKIKQINDSCATLVSSAYHFSLLGDYEKASELILLSHNLKKNLYSDLDPVMANSLINLAITNTNIWNFELALNYLNQAEEIYIKNPTIDEGYLGYTYALIGNIYYKSGEFTRAENYFKIAKQKLISKSKEPFQTLRIYLLIWYGQLKKSQHEYDASISYLNEALELTKTNKSFNTTRITVLGYYSFIYEQQNKFIESINFQERAVELCKLDLSNNLLQLGILYSNIAQNYLSLQNFDLAQEYFNKSLMIIIEHKFKGTYPADLYLFKGKMEEMQGNLAEALKNYNVSLQMIAPKFDNSNLLDNPKATLINAKLPTLKTLEVKAKCLYKIYQQKDSIIYLKAALSATQLSIELIENLRNSYQSYDSKMELAALEDKTYKYALNLCLQTYKATNDLKYNYQAFEIAEKNKSAVLLSSIHELSARNLGGIPDSLLKYEQLLSKNIAFYRENIYEESQNQLPDKSKLNTWEAYLFKEQRDHDQLIKQFEIQFPGYYQLKYTNEVVSTSVVSTTIGRNEAILEYSLTDSLLYIFVVTNNGMTTTKQTIDSTFWKLTNDYLQEFHQFDFSRQSYSHFTEFCWKSKALYDYLIAPVEKLIANKTHLVIVPDGALSFLPFETLIKELPNSIPKGYYKDLNYLLYKFSVSYAYSSTLYIQAKNTINHIAKHKLAAFAPIYEANANINIQNTRHLVTRQKYRKNLYPIPGVREEVDGISSLLTSDVFEDDKATEGNFKMLAGNYDILHLAMHTVVDNENPLYSKLVFTQIPDSSNDGLLNTYEIFGLNLNARMVVLSACSSGDGDYSKGEGVMSLARGFIYAGSPSLVMTLWEVEDQSGASLMKYFYKYLLKGMSKDKALQKAKIDFIQSSMAQNAHPFFWSSFVVLGNSDALFVNQLVYIVPALVLVILVILVFYLLYRKKQAKFHRLS